MATLVRSVMLGMKHAAPHMRRQGSGSIINNGSIAGRLAGFSSSVVYGAAKAAVIHLTKCVAMELGESGIRVNSISPGAIATGIFGKALGLSVEAAEKTPDVMREVYKTAQPIPRAGLPEDIAHAAVFLASDESSFINGHDLVIDGAITGGRNWTAQQQGYVALRKAFDQARGRLTSRGGKNVRERHGSNRSELRQEGGIDVCNIPPDARPLSGDDRRSCLRLRDRQGLAVGDGCVYRDDPSRYA
jgi:NADP-dependent 3-hydroxy acid dehydrogenase YdfG